MNSQSPTMMGFPDQGVKLADIVREIERSYVSLALEKSAGNKAQAARLLGLNRTTLFEKMRRLGMPLQAKQKPAQAE